MRSTTTHTFVKLIFGLAFLLSFSVAKALPVVANGSFESGDFTGWTTVTTGSPFRPWAVTGAGQGGGFGMATTSPQDGSFVAWNGFDGFGPMEFQMFQDVFIPTGASVLSWDHRVQWNFALGADATLARLFTVEIRDATSNALLSTLFSFSTGTQAVNPSGDTGWLTETADVSAFENSTVRLSFREQIPQSSTGPAQIEFDDISISASVPAPTTLLLIGLGLAGIAHRRRKQTNMA